MKSREEVVKLIKLQLNDLNSERTGAREKGSKAHYGKQELRELLDFIYGSTPENELQ